MRKPITAAILLLALAIAAGAQQKWRLVATNAETGKKAFFKLKTTTGRYIEAWTRHDLPSSQTIVLAVYDCQEDRIRKIQLTVRSKDGQVAVTNEKQLVEIGAGEWKHPEPDTLSEMTLRAVCKAASPKP